MPHLHRARRALALALAVAFPLAVAACRDREDADADRPGALVGTWVGRVEGSGSAGSSDSVALTLASDASASVRRWTTAQAAAHFDSTAHYALWKLTGPADNRGSSICLHLPATGANDCIPIRSRGDDSLQLALPARPLAPGAVVDVTLHRASGER